MLSKVNNLKQVLSKNLLFRNNRLLRISTKENFKDKMDQRISRNQKMEDPSLKDKMHQEI